METRCQFCDRMHREPNRWADEILMETEDFIVTPSLGSLVEGWLLIAPKLHYLCFGQIRQSAIIELQSLKNKLTEMLGYYYGRTVFFEHGPSEPTQVVGCTVDHAHLHVVPTDCRMRSGLDAIFPGLEWQAIDGLVDARSYFRRGLPYLYLEEDGESIIATHHAFTSQLFRRVLANYEGMSQQYDWRQYPYFDNIEATVNTLRQHMSHEANDRYLRSSLINEAK